MPTDKKKTSAKSTTERWADKAKKTSSKPKPKDLGKGMASKAASAITSRRRQLDEAMKY
jgi:hypothetical protein